MGNEWSASRPGRFTPQGVKLQYPLDRGWVGPGDGVDAVENKKFPDPNGIQTPVV
jgi:hypothetical protein